MRFIQYFLQVVMLHSQSPAKKETSLEKRGGSPPLSSDGGQPYAARLALLSLPPSSAMICVQSIVMLGHSAPVEGSSVHSLRQGARFQLAVLSDGGRAHLFLAGLLQP